MTEIKHLPLTEDPKRGRSEEAEPIQLYSPTGVPIRGSLEKLCGTALRDFFLEADGTVTVEFTGETDIFWDSQTTEAHPDGGVVWLDDDGQEWRFSELRAAPPRFEVNYRGETCVVDTRTDRKLFLDSDLQWISHWQAAARLNRLQYQAELDQRDLTPEMVEEAARQEVTRQQVDAALRFGVLKDER